MKKTIQWLKPSFEDKAFNKDGTGRASIRRLTAVVVLFLYTVSRLYFAFTSLNAQYLFYALTLDAVFFLVLMGIILIQHIVEFKQGYKPTEAKNNLPE